MDIDEVKVTEVTGGNFTKSDLVPEDTYTVQITNLKKVEGTDFNTKEPVTKVEMEFTVLDGDQSGKKLYMQIMPKIGKGDKPSNLWKLIVCTLGEIDTTDFHLSSLKDQILRVLAKEAVSKTGTKYSKIAEFLKAKK